ncbi:hypothetical protein [Pararhodospirillum oryzae]|uniref:Uncharacterized protein n=1 Tax=Pararhodospirillum oryzae TaxID=478448 RepID=A0A512HAV5_9PROT|nr:hypothetical protein [Pararhodospirillum oryzae]GEO82593.1 hypothetical protein ROR02_27240 [Pararhodospirillum oryzae]
MDSRILNIPVDRSLAEDFPHRLGKASTIIREHTFEELRTIISAIELMVPCSCGDSDDNEGDPLRNSLIYLCTQARSSLRAIDNALIDFNTFAKPLNDAMALELKKAKAWDDQVRSRAIVEEIFTRDLKKKADEGMEAATNG